jgi:hypothetical protein
MIPITAGMTGSQFLTALNNSAKTYNVKDYGAIGNGVADDTVAIQATINAVFAAGGGIVYFPFGTYIIAGALQRNIGGIDYKSQLYVPFTSIVTTTKPVIKLLGECNINGTGTTSNGVILRSTLISNVALSSVIGSIGLAGGGNFETFNYTDCHIENIRFHIESNSSGAMTLGTIGFARAGNTMIKGVTCHPILANGATVTATPINNCIGIDLPMVNCQGFVYVENCVAGGFESGFKTGDHAVLVDCFAETCIYGFNFGKSNLINHALKIETNWCVNDMYFSGDTYVYISSFNSEWHNSGSVWYDSVYTVLDDSSLGHGEIHYTMSEFNVGYNDARFAKSGGTKLQCMPIGFAAASSFTVTGKRNDATALTSLLTKLAAKGIIIDSTTAS